MCFVSVIRQQWLTKCLQFPFIHEQHLILFICLQLHLASYCSIWETKSFLLFLFFLDRHKWSLSHETLFLFLSWPKNPTSCHVTEKPESSEISALETLPCQKTDRYKALTLETFSINVYYTTISSRPIIWLVKQRVDISHKGTGMLHCVYQMIIRNLTSDLIFEGLSDEEIKGRRNTRFTRSTFKGNVQINVSWLPT